MEKLVQELHSAIIANPQALAEQIDRELDVIECGIADVRMIDRPGQEPDFAAITILVETCHALTVLRDAISSGPTEDMPEEDPVIDELERAGLYSNPVDTIPDPIDTALENAEWDDRFKGPEDSRLQDMPPEGHENDGCDMSSGSVAPILNEEDYNDEVPF